MEELGFGYYPTHPGEILKDELESRGISQRKLANSIEISYTVLNELLNGRRPLTTTTALKFEAALHIPAETLMKLQLRYNMHAARKDKSLNALLKRINKAAALL